MCACPWVTMSAMLPGSLQIPAFRRLVAASTLSVTGSLMTFIVLPLVAWEATGSATTFGLVMTGGSIGMIVALPFGGLIADRFDRRRVMLAGDLVAIVVTAELDGHMADACITVGVPPVSERAQRLIRVARPVARPVDRPCACRPIVLTA
jgi:MFS family permease